MCHPRAIHPLVASQPPSFPMVSGGGRVRQQAAGDAILSPLAGSWTPPPQLSGVFLKDTSQPASFCSPFLPPCIGLLLHRQHRVIFHGTANASSGMGSMGGAVITDAKVAAPFCPPAGATLSHSSVARAQRTARDLQSQALGQIRLTPCSDRGCRSSLKARVMCRGGEGFTLSTCTERHCKLETST